MRMIYFISIAFVVLIPEPAQVTVNVLEQKMTEDRSMLDDIGKILDLEENQIVEDKLLILLKNYPESVIVDKLLSQNFKKIRHETGTSQLYLLVKKTGNITAPERRFGIIYHKDGSYEAMVRFVGA